MVPMWMFRSGHQPLLIAWDRFVSAETTTYFFYTVLQLTIQPEYETETFTIRLMGHPLRDLVGEKVNRKN